MTSNYDTSNALTVQDHYQAPAVAGDGFDYDDPSASPVRGAQSSTPALMPSARKKLFLHPSGSLLFSTRRAAGNS
jgi:hypothetical protein